VKPPKSDPLFQATPYTPSQTTKSSIQHIDTRSYKRRTDAPALTMVTAALDYGYTVALIAIHKLLDAAHIPHVPTYHNASSYTESKRPHPEVRGWKPYRKRLASVQEVEAWQATGLIGGWGIVTGNTARLIIVDLDADADPDAPAKFTERFPDLETTYTERTPTGGLHLLYRLPPGISAPASIPASIGELRGEGAFTVIAPTCWRDMRWRVEYGDLTTIHTLTNAQLERLIAFYHEYPKTTAPTSPPTVTPAASGGSSLPTTDAEMIEAIKLKLGVTTINPATGFSNNVLCPFHNDVHPSAQWNEHKRSLKCHAGCTTGKKPGWNNRFKVAAALGLHHLIPPLASSNPPNMIQLQPTVMFNEIRETLLGAKLDAVSRLLDVLYSAGITPGSSLTEKDIVERCKGSIGRTAILKALKATYHIVDTDTGEITQKVFFVCVLYTPANGANTKDTNTYVLDAKTQTKNQAARGTGSDEPKRGRGRPPGSGAAQYLIPSIDYLLDLLVIDRDHLHADALPADALTNATKYAMAIHAALIDRKSKEQYSMRMLKQRVSRTRMTIYRYNKAEGIVGIPVYHRTRITWANVSSLPFLELDDIEKDKRGKRKATYVFIEDVTDVPKDADTLGQRHPPLAVIAKRLLGQGRSLYLTYQEANAWIYKRIDEPPPAPIFKLQVGTPTVQPRSLPKAAGAENMSVPPAARDTGDNITP